VQDRCQAAPRRIRRFHTSLSPATSASISASVCNGDGARRKRSVPRGVGVAADALMAMDGRLLFGRPRAGRASEPRARSARSGGTAILAGRMHAPRKGGQQHDPLRRVHRGHCRVFTISLVAHAQYAEPALGTGTKTVEIVIENATKGQVFSPGSSPRTAPGSLSRGLCRRPFWNQAAWRKVSRVHTSARAATRVSISVSLCRGEGVSRSRSVPRGTVG